MKNKKIFTHSLLLLIFLCSLQGYSQYTNPANYVLPSLIGTQTQYTARDYIKLTPGFTFTATGSTTATTLNAKIDELSIPLVNPNPTSPILANDPALEIDTLLPVAAIPGKAGVSGSGAATYEIPIGMPPGTKGMVPNLSIVYNSQAGNGIMGLGWNISGLSAITRIPQTFYKNGNTTAVDFSANDRFALDGNRLVQTVGTVYGANNAEYHTESENFSRIISYVTSGTGPSYFKVYTTDGSVIEYGNVNPNNTVADSRFIPSISTGPIQTVYSWHINKITDKFGNYMLFKYRTINNELIIDEIEYTGTVNFTPYNKVKFYYEEKNDKSFYYVGGVKLQQNLLLSKIKVFAETQIRDEFTFDYYYDNALAATKLKKVNQKVNGQTDINSTKVLWYDNEGFDEMTELPFNESNYGICTSNCLKKYNVGDFNGDGKSDIIVTEGWHDNGEFYGTYFKIFLANNSNFFNFNSQPDCSGDFGGSLQFRNFTVLDFDNDGADELLFRLATSITTPPITETYYIYKLQSNNTLMQMPLNGFVNNYTVALPSKFASPLNHQFIDFNGDGRRDMISIASTQLYDIITNISITTPVNGIFEPNTFSYYGMNNSKIHFVDFNGNGKTDIMITNTNNTIIYEFTGSVAPSSFSPIYWDSFPLYAPNNPTAGHYYLTGDFNGDKKTDILFYNYIQQIWQIAYSTGTGFSWPYTNLSNINAPTDGVYNNFNIVDINGDGKDDIIEARWGSGAKLKIYYSNSYSFNAVANNTIQNNFDVPLQFGDFNGDGKVDILGYSGTTPYILSVQTRYKTNMIKSIYNGFKNINEFNYKTLSAGGDNFYKKGNDNVFFPFAKTQPALYCVSSLLSTESISGNNTREDYYYEKLQFHISDKKLLGFANLNKTLYANSVEIGTNKSFFDELSSTYLNNLMLKRTEKWVKDGANPVLTEEIFYNYFPEVIYGGGISSTDRYDRVNFFSLLKYTTTLDHPNNIKKESGYLNATNINDVSHGNYSVTDHIIEKTYNSISDITPYYILQKDITYKSPPAYANWYASQISLEKITSKLSNTLDPDYIRTKNYYYVPNNLNNLNKIVSDELNPDFNVSEEYTYNVFGEVVSTKINPPTNNSNPATAVVAITDSKEYDDKGRFVTKEINDLNHITQYFYEPKFGNVIKTIDPNLFETNFEYDAIGRKKKTIFHDNTFENISNTWALGGSNPTNSLYKVVSSSSGNPDNTTYYDAMGRDILSKSINFNGTEVFAQKNYNAKGQLSSASLPYFTTGTPLFTTYTYDNYGRKTQELQPLPDGTITNIAYNGRTTTVSSGKNTNFQQKTSVSNCLGQVESVTDNSNQTITYTYNNQGLVKQTNVSGMTQAVITSYNLHGKRISLQDPDAGLSTTIYDAYDQVREQRDAKQNALAVPVGTKMQYDKLGRITSRTHKNGATDCITTYEYDNPNNLPNKLKGSLSKVTAWNGTTDEYFYDALGRDWKTVESIDGVSYTETMGYDNLGRLETYTYPDNYIIKYEYQNGQLAKVKTNNNATIWEALQQDNMGNITKYKSGSSEETNKYYDPSNGRLTGISTGVGSNSSIQNLAYDYDVFGNLGMRSDAITQQAEHFTYDNLNRLNERTIFHNGPQVDYSAMQYDNTGNITIMPGIGNFIYSGINAGPHAITKIENNIGNINTTQNIDYTAFNKVEEIREPNSVGIQQKLTFTYGADYSRRKTQYYNNGNLVSTKYFLMGNYEVKVNPATGLSVKDHYISGGEGLAAIYRVNEAGVGTMYYIHKDHLGSFDVVTDGNGNIIEKYSFDVWGNRRNPNEWKDADSRTTWLFDRGFTGHEHLDKFGLINMNGRLYDPKLGRFLSPDPYLQEPDNTQNFNRYSYCWNNPLVYTDPNGEFVHIIVGAVIGGVINFGIKVAQGKIHSFQDGLVAFGVGALAGGIGAATGGAAFIAAGGAAGGAGGFLAGAVSGMTSSAFTMPIQSLGNSLYFHDPLMTMEEYAAGIAFGGILGGTINGLSALKNGRGFLNGNPKPTIKPLPDIRTPLTPPNNKNEIQLANNGRSQINPLPDDSRGIFKLDIKENYRFLKVNTPDGVKYVRDPNFRSNLIKTSGLNPGKLSQAHHVFPQKFAHEFAKAGIDVNEYGAWWTTEIHLSNSSSYNSCWKSFFKTNINPSRYQIFEEAYRLKSIFGY